MRINIPCRYSREMHLLSVEELPDKIFGYQSDPEEYILN
jgi:hypothetical protein